MPGTRPGMTRWEFRIAALLARTCPSAVLAEQVGAADVAPGEAGADGGAGADGAGADRVRHGVSGAVEAGDDAAVGPEYLALLVGARAALGADRRAVERHRDEGRLFNRAERGIARGVVAVRLVALPDALAAMEILVASLADEAVEALDRRLEGVGG